MAFKNSQSSPSVIDGVSHAWGRPDLFISTASHYPPGCFFLWSSTAPGWNRIMFNTPATIYPLLADLGTNQHAIPICAPPPAAPATTTNQVITNAPNVGSWGGTCTCPDGQVYQVGDNHDVCGSLACVDGTAGTCGSHNPGGAHQKVICHTNVPPDCTNYLSTTGCDWTTAHACPGAASPGTSGSYATNDGSHGFQCCCLTPSGANA